METIFYCVQTEVECAKKQHWRKSGISRTDCRFTARVCVSDKLCSSFCLLPRARFSSSNNLGGIVYSAGVSQQTSIGSHNAGYLPLLHLQSSRLTSHSHNSFPSLAVTHLFLGFKSLDSQDRLNQELVRSMHSKFTILIQNTIHTSSQIQYRSIRKFNLI